MAQLDTLTLFATNPKQQEHFYRETLGMRDQGNGRVGYSSQQVALCFKKVDNPYEHRPTDLYWKITVSVPDIDLAYKQLQAMGISCTEPYQFRDVGYLAKFIDPAGYTVELIDHYFKGHRPQRDIDANLFGGGAHLNLVTLRTDNIEAIEPTLLAWGMRSLSIQQVEPNGFTLYFYAFTDELPPSADLTALENRTWVYQRPYSVLEIQHLHKPASEIRFPERSFGYGGLTVNSDPSIDPYHRLGIIPEKG